ncbi:hypothetical protein Tco_0212248 [Tanacetum coccineum]
MKSSTNMAWNLGSRMSGVELSQTTLKREILSLRKDTSEIKSMMTEIYAAFQGHPSSAPSGSVTPTLTLTDIQANVEGENANTTATEESPSHTEGETEEPRLEIPISSIPSTVIPPTQAQPITLIIIHPESSQATSKIDKGKRIATNSDDDPSKKLVKASSIVRPDPDEPVRTTRKKEEQIKKAEEEARLLAMTKHEVIKVVQEEAEKIGLDPKAIKGVKAGEMFKKAQDAKHVVLKRQHTEKVRKSLKLRKYKGIYGRNFDVYEPFLFGAFGISELDELREIIPKKKNAMVKDLMNSLSRRYERLKKIPEELGIHSALPAPVPEQASSRSSGMNGSTWNLSLKQESLDWNAIKLSLKMSRSSTTWSLKNLAASMVKSAKNARFSMKLRKLIAKHPHQKKLESKKVKLEALGYKIN